MPEDIDIGLRAIKERAERAGIHVDALVCPRCVGSGEILRPDPIDLKRWREEQEVSLYSFAQNVVKPDGAVGLSTGFINKVENPDPEKGAPCPLWLLERYLEIPDGEWRAKDWRSDAKPPAAEPREAQEPLPAPRRLSVWQRIKPASPVRRVDVLTAAEADGKRWLLVQPREDDGARPYVVDEVNFRRRYEEVVL